MTDDAKTTARLLYTGAVGFLVAAEATHDHHTQNPTEPDHWPAISVNLCFALELSLKAFIALRGGSKTKLKKIGHNLITGLQSARATGYSPTHRAIEDLVNILSPLHDNHTLRYLENKWTDIPDTRNMIAIVKRHVLDIGAQLPISDL